MKLTEPLILAIDTSFDETALAITSGRRVLVNRIYSQIATHKSWGGVVPSLAKRAHEERFDWVLTQTIAAFARLTGAAFDQNNPLETLRGTLSAVAVTKGPGLAIALEVGIHHAKAISEQLRVPIVAVNHMEGHLLSAFVQNRGGKPVRTLTFPLLGMLVSGAHTEIVLCRDIADYELLGATVDDAAGEALDKAARMLGFGYPGGAVIERLATEAESVDTYQFPRPMINSGNLNFSFSGLKTALLYTIRPMSEETRVGAVRELASSFQQAVFDVLCKKLEAAIAQTGVTTVAVGGGVFSNDLLRKRVRQVVSARGGRVFAPSKKYLYVDNAAMIGVVAGFRFRRGEVATEFDLDRAPRLSL